MAEAVAEAVVQKVEGGPEPLTVISPRRPSVFWRVLTGSWLFLAWAGWVIALGGLSRLQKVVNANPGRTHGSRDVSTWAIPANYPDLSRSRVFRLDWFIVFLEFVVLSLITIVLLSKKLEQARTALVGILAATTVLQVISTNNFYNVRSFRSFTPASCAFSGFLIAATADFALLYQLGVQHVTYTQLPI